MPEECENDQNKINIDAEPVETDTEEAENPEPVETETKEKVIGTFVTKTVGIHKHKKSCKVKCRLCGTSCANVKELNHHHREDHDIQFCVECRKGLIPKQP